MSVKISQDFFLNKFKSIYPDSNISITEWNGYTKSIRFICDKCQMEHYISDSRQLLQKKHYCPKVGLDKINQKFLIEDFKYRINKLHGESIDIIEYHGLSDIIKYYCPRCHQVKSCKPARTLLTRLSLCDECYGIEHNVVEKKIRDKFDNSNNYKLITWRGVGKKLTEQCLKCGYIYDRYPANVLQCFDSCPNCYTGKGKQKLPLDQMQERIDQAFGENEYKLLTYSGQLNRHNKIKCLSCGLIFESHFVAFVNESRGCPKCKRFKSKGEQKVQKYLENHSISFEAQKRFKDCNNNLSSFDFCVYDKEGKMYLIEVNGIQHYKDNTRFEGLEVIKRRDQIKIDYCKNNNIPLIIIPYNKLTDKDIDSFLSFLKGSTTIPQGSREQATGS